MKLFFVKKTKFIFHQYSKDSLYHYHSEPMYKNPTPKIS